MNAFNTALNNTTLPLAIDDHAESQTLLMAFGGINGRMGIPPFEFFNLTADFAIQKIYVRDLHQAWYQYGLTGLTHSVDETARYLSAIVRAKNPARVVVCGNSMGGYAALLFGHLLEADEVLAFSPQTFINPLARFLLNDHRWRRQIRHAHHAPQAQKETFDLQKFFTAHPPQKTNFHLYYSTDIRLDARHATRLGATPRLTLYPCSKTGHDLVRHLRDLGQLTPILTRALQIP